jgi:hypothetical protein
MTTHITKFVKCVPNSYISTRLCFEIITSKLFQKKNTTGTLCVLFDNLNTNAHAHTLGAKKKGLFGKGNLANQLDS